jgi:hypothetical protein
VTYLFPHRVYLSTSHHLFANFLPPHHTSPHGHTVRTSLNEIYRSTVLFIPCRSQRHMQCPTPLQCSPPGWITIANCSPFRSVRLGDFSSICPQIDRMPNCSNLKLLFTALAKRPRPSQRGIRPPSCRNTFGIGHGGPGAEKTFRHYRPRRSRKIGNTGKHLSCSSELRPSSGNGAAGVFVLKRSPHFSHSSE